MALLCMLVETAAQTPRSTTNKMASVIVFILTPDKSVVYIR